MYVLLHIHWRQQRQETRWIFNRCVHSKSTQRQSFSNIRRSIIPLRNWRQTSECILTNGTDETTNNVNMKSKVTFSKSINPCMQDKLTQQITILFLNVDFVSIQYHCNELCEELSRFRGHATGERRNFEKAIMFWYALNVDYISKRCYVSTPSINIERENRK